MRRERPTTTLPEPEVQSLTSQCREGHLLETAVEEIIKLRAERDALRKALAEILETTVDMDTVHKAYTALGYA